MKKFVIFLLVIIAIMVAWKYTGTYIKKRALQTAPISAADNTLDSVGGYIPGQIERKNTMENSVSGAVQKENDRLKQSLTE